MYIYSYCIISKLVSAVLVVVGHWLLVNVVFHFLMALTTSPGRPPTDKVLEQVSSICKKCISPKPIRTHHCRSVNKCAVFIQPDNVLFQCLQHVHPQDGPSLPLAQ